MEYYHQHHHHHHHEHWRVTPTASSLNEKGNLFNIFFWLPIFLLFFGWHHSACFRILFASILSKYRSHLCWYCGITKQEHTYLITYLLHGAESFLRSQPVSASQEIPLHLWSPKTHYRFHKCPPPVPIPSQINPTNTSPSNFLKIHLKIILQSMPGPSNWSFSLRHSHQNTVYNSPLPHTCYMPRQSH